MIVSTFTLRLRSGLGADVFWWRAASSQVADYAVYPTCIPRLQATTAKSGDSDHLTHRQRSPTSCGDQAQAYGPAGAAIEGRRPGSLTDRSRDHVFGYEVRKRLRQPFTASLRTGEVIVGIEHGARLYAERRASSLSASSAAARSSTPSSMKATEDALASVPAAAWAATPDHLTVCPENVSHDRLLDFATTLRSVIAGTLDGKLSVDLAPYGSSAERTADTATGRTPSGSSRLAPPSVGRPAEDLGAPGLVLLAR